MIPELGHFALILALAVALMQVCVPAYGLWKRDARALAVATTAAQAQFFLVATAYVCLTWCFVQHDYSVAYVAANSHSELPLHYRITAVWGAHEGSVLLWVTILACWTLAVSVFNRRLPADLSATALAVLGAISVGFLAFIQFTSDPFARNFPVPDNGRDLNPLLQDPGMVIHPPMLYMGYVGFSVAFAYSIAALISGRLDAAWARWVRPWTTTAWMFLTLGITLGSWWAYNELGWGGWWFWDPVENASFMPWLVGTALIHSLAVTEKRGLLKSWTVLLAILAFALSLLGTFLVRSGVLVSVHAFASDPARGIFILCFLSIVLGIAFTLYAWRAPKLATAGELNLFSREGLLLINNVFLVVAAASVLLGTLYPLVVDSLKLGKISVGPPYFNSVFVPLFAPLVLLVGLAAVLPWKRGRWSDVVHVLRMPFAAALVLGVLIPLVTVGEVKPAVAAGAWLGCWAMLTAGIEVWRRVRAKRALSDGLASVPRGAWGMALAHFGLGLWALGVTVVSGHSIEKDTALAPGQGADIGAFTFTLLQVQRGQGPNYKSDIGSIAVERAGRRIADLHPEKRQYDSTQQVMTESAVDVTPLRDLYVSLGEPLDGGGWSVRLYFKPMMHLVWLGGVLMFLGGLLAATDRRYRLAVGAGLVRDQGSDRAPGALLQ
ncbi:MAG TPA: heme lyase CcmF/NrfE family subunit [Nevskiaceae bacterium]|nr:heme lyase CcmF/NrfE family subunit [Nevskiaceae bacterium]